MDIEAIEHDTEGAVAPEKGGIQVKQFFKFFLAVISGFVVFTFVLLLAIGLAIPRRAPVVIPAKMVLHFDMSQPVTDRPRQDGLVDIIRTMEEAGIKKPLSARMVTESIEYAAGDERVAGLYLSGLADGVDYESGWAVLSEVRNAIETFKASGKKVIAYHRSLNEKSYYLSSLADTIYMPPAGIIEMNGLTSTVFFFEEALRKIGIGVQVVREGEYKSAVEPYLRNSISDENRMQLLALQDTIFSVWIDEVASSRPISLETIPSITARGLFDSEAGITLNLIDGIASEDIVLDEVEELTGLQPTTDRERILPIRDYGENIRPDRGPDDPRIAILYAEGMIMEGSGGDDIRTETFIPLVKKAKEDVKVKGVVLRINSPGGGFDASARIHRELTLLAEEKPLVVSMGNIAASGGYYIAAAGDYIFTHPSTITGSIGIYALYPNMAGLMDNIGITSETVSTNDSPDLSPGYRFLTKIEIAFIDEIIEKKYAVFLDTVASGRRLPKQEVRRLAGGRVWSGRAALDAKLADSAGGLEDAIAETARRAGIEDAYRVVEYTTARDLSGLLSSFFRAAGEAIAERAIPARYGNRTLGHLAGQLAAAAGLLEQLNDPDGIYAALPFLLETD